MISGLGIAVEVPEANTPGVFASTATDVVTGDIRRDRRG